MQGDEAHATTTAHSSTIPKIMPTQSPRPPLSAVASKIVLGGAGFSTQLHPDPESLPVRDIIRHALKLGFRTFDTSPYYGPSEWLLGDAFSHPDITATYDRSDIILMTKVGRIAALEFNYDPAWVRFSVERSLERFRTSYLDVVFCHDIEYVTDEDAVVAVGVLLDFVAQGKIHYVGVSGYSLPKLIRVAELVRERYGRPLDAVQNWAQLTLQNTKLETEGLGPLKDAGVDCVFNSSPLCIGLLRDGGVPVGSLGDFHPAPSGLREAAAEAAKWVKAQGEDLASLSLRYAVSQHSEAGPRPQGASMIFGGGSIWEIDENLATVRKILEPNGNVHGDLRDLTVINEARRQRDLELVAGVREIFGKWVDYGFTSPDEGWDVVTKAMTVADAVEDASARAQPNFEQPPVEAKL